MARIVVAGGSWSTVTYLHCNLNQEINTNTSRPSDTCNQLHDSSFSERRFQIQKKKIKVNGIFIEGWVRKLIFSIRDFIMIRKDLKSIVQDLSTNWRPSNTFHRSMKAPPCELLLDRFPPLICELRYLGAGRRRGRTQESEEGQSIFSAAQMWVP